MDIKIIKDNLNELRTVSPLVHNITNYVVMNNTANALLAVGASPVMAHAIEEVEEITTISSALVINIGTLSEKWIDSMIIATKKAKDLGKPIVLDPVGAGASKLRTETCKRIIKEACPDIIRGNASEIMALMDSNIQTKGVDSSHETNEALDIAKAMSKELGNTIAITGKTDYVVSNGQVVEIENGSVLMGQVTGMGCTATAIIGAFAGVAENSFEAAVSALAIMGIAGELTEEVAAGPGSFQMSFYDALFGITEDDIFAKLRIQSYEA